MARRLRHSSSQRTVNPPEKVTASWMPHTSLALSSHVCFTVRSGHTIRDETNTPQQQDECSLEIFVYGGMGQLLVPVSCRTMLAPLLERPRRDDQKPVATPSSWKPTISKVTHDCYWNDFITLPIRWRDLPRDAYLRLKVSWDRSKPGLQTTLPLFDKYGKLQCGLIRIDLSAGGQGASSNTNDESFGSRDPVDADDDPAWKASLVVDDLARIEQRISNNQSIKFGENIPVPWLDTMERQLAKEALIQASFLDVETCLLYDEKHESMAVILELPVFDVPVLYEETFYPTPQQGASGPVSPLDLAVYREENRPTAESSNTIGDPMEMVSFIDFEDEHDNPVEDKYRALAHDLLRGLVDPALKPDKAQRQRLATIIDSPSHHPTREEKDLLWRFRFSLVDNHRALAKFLVAVDWTVESEVVQAAELLEQWRRRSPIEVTDALKLLGKHVAFQTNLVRSYAIETLAGAPDSELRLYLLQLVQALKYENTEDETNDQESNEDDRDESTTGKKGGSPLANFLISRAAANIQLANYLYWYIKVELDSPTHGSRYREVFAALEARLTDAPFDGNSFDPLQESSASKSLKNLVGTVSNKIGASFLGSDSVAGGDEMDETPQRSMWDVLVAQDEFISGVLDAQLRCRELRGKKDAKEAELQDILKKEGFSPSGSRLSVPLPSAPEILVNGLRPEATRMFKSALYPARVEFNVEGVAKYQGEDALAKDGRPRGPLSPRLESHPSSFKVIVKTGDDLRQDQLIMMMIQLMDGLLKRAALDLCLTPYSVIALSPTSGLVEFVDGSLPISQILSDYNGSVLQYFQTVSPATDAKYGVHPDVMFHYVRSCAAYCVITYLLGVGDRHLDNIMLRSSGHFFHIDFGFVFGRDPKPLPPAFRLTREMVEGMGGMDSSEYKQFCSLACQAFNALRKSAGLVLNLLDLMNDACIEDLSNNPAADTEGVLAKVEERFRLDFTEEQAEQYFLGLINDCLSAIAPRVMDVFHSFSQARR